MKETNPSNVVIELTSQSRPAEAESYSEHGSDDERRARDDGPLKLHLVIDPVEVFQLDRGHEETVLPSFIDPVPVERVILEFLESVPVLPETYYLERQTN